MKYFVKCDCCGKKIYVGDKMYQTPGYCGIYCSLNCWTRFEANVEITALTVSEADNCGADLFSEYETGIVGMVDENKIEELIEEEKNAAQ